MAAGDLTTIANAQGWIPGLDATIGARLITAVSTQIQNWISYQVASQQYARVLNGHGGRQMVLPDPNVTAVSSVVIDGVIIAASTGAPALGYLFDDKSIYLIGARFTRGVQNVAVSYTAGLPSIPLDIEQGCLEWIKVTWERYTTRSAAASLLKANSSEMRFDNDATMGGSSLIAPMPAAVFALLQPYARVYS